jgi:gluconolactonase
MLEAHTLAEVTRLEGIACGPDGKLYGGDDAGRIFRIEPDGSGAAEIARTDGWALGLACDGTGHLYVCTSGPEAVVRVNLSTGAADVWSDSIEGRPYTLPNYPAFAPDGTLYVSDSGPETPGDLSGRVVAVPPGGGDATVVAGGFDYSNGIALSADAQTLYVVETFDNPGIAALSLADGTHRRHVDLPRTVPDGVAVCDDGGLVVSCFQPNQIYRVPPGGGTAELVLDDWRGLQTLTPSNVAFYGPGGSRMAIASLAGWRVSWAETPWRGLPLKYPG